MKTAIAVFALIAAAGAPPAEEAPLRLTVEAAESRGAVYVAVFDSEQAWAAGTATAYARIDLDAGQSEAVLGPLPVGDYGLKAFQDLDGDGELGVNPFGVPTEPFAFSNNARGSMGPAPWSAARFRHDGATAQSLSFR